MSMTQRSVTFAAMLLLLVTAFAEPLPWPRGCTAPQQVTRFTGKLSNTADAIRSGKPLVIVAIG